MKVYTYFDVIPGIDPVADRMLIKLWEASWIRHGWEPVVLSRADAAASDPSLCARLALSDELQRGPCPEGYNLACHMRWVAYLATGGGVFSDYDVMNNGFAPADLQAVVADLGESAAIFLHANNCPCVVSATPTNIHALLDAILLHADQVDAGNLDVSKFEDELAFVAHDQAIFGRFSFSWLYPPHSYVAEYLDSDWRKAPLIHFCNTTTPSPRAVTVQETGMF